MRPDAAAVLTNLLLQGGIAVVVAGVLTWLWRVRGTPYLRWIGASWWFAALYVGGSAVAFGFSTRGTPSTLWQAATFASQAGAVLHALLLVAGVRMLLGGDAPRRRVLLAAIAVALLHAAVAAWLPAAGADGAPLRRMLRTFAPYLLLTVAYLAVVPGLWRSRRKGEEYGTTLLISALVINAVAFGTQTLGTLLRVVSLTVQFDASALYPLTVVGQAVFGLAWTGVLLEYEQRRHRESADRANRADKLLREALDASDDLIAIVDTQERLVQCNARMARIAESVTGTPMQPLMPYPNPGRTPEERARFIATIRRALGGERVTERVPVFTPAGGSMILDRRIVPIHEGDRVVGAFVVARDVTQAEALRSEAERSMRVEALARMAGGLAHDFNNILTVVQTNLQLIAESSPHDGETSDMLMESAAALDRANQLTRQLLGIARERPGESTRIDVGALLQGLERFLQRAIGDEITLTVALPDGEAPVTIDAGRLEQVLLNLALNARDAMPRGGALRVGVRAESLAALAATEGSLPAGPYIVVTVTDEGVGMDAETLQRAGDPFFTTKHATVGSGLGLATCRAIIEEADGALLLSSVPGAGTTARIWLPRAR